MDYACMALTVLNKSHRQRLEVIRCLFYTRRAVDSACISNNVFLTNFVLLVKLLV